MDLDALRVTVKRARIIANVFKLAGFTVIFMAVIFVPDPKFLSLQSFLQIFLVGLGGALIEKSVHYSNVAKGVAMMRASESQLREFQQFARHLILDEEIVDNICLSYRHDFGIMSEEDKEQLRSECIHWVEAYKKESNRINSMI